MGKIYAKITATLFLLMWANIAFSEAVQLDHENTIIYSTLTKFSDKYLCPNALNLPMMRERVDDFLRKQGTGNTPSDDAIAKATYTLFPCPFTPYSQEFRPATAKDIEGTWSYPATSQKLRFGPKSPSWAKFAMMPIKCEAIAYHPDGVVLHVQFGGATGCPFASASDVENIFRPYPKVESWKVIGDGRIKISRTDVQNHIEEWDVFVVAVSHEQFGIHFDAGDIVEFVRRENGNEYNVATQFRHLKRMP
jgi:hypothetical protein